MCIIYLVKSPLSPHSMKLKSFFETSPFLLGFQFLCVTQSLFRIAGTSMVGGYFSALESFIIEENASLSPRNH